ncbi:MAG: nucleotide exchange factor GrpE [Acidimicrobiales bacterium]|nr:nucleotide exchange factor GrpE [Acidimicrobiales bacterium]
MTDVPSPGAPGSEPSSEPGGFGQAPSDPFGSGAAPVPPDAEPRFAADDAGGPIHVESLLADLERVTGERDSHLQDLQRVSAEFANFRKQASRRQQEIVDQAASGLVEKLLPVLDACEAALGQGATDVAPIRSNLVEILGREGLLAVSEAGEEFDPNLHEAVLHEAGEGGTPVVAEVLRAGYVWNGRTLRPAMVKVRG